MLLYLRVTFSLRSVMNLHNLFICFQLLCLNVQKPPLPSKVPGHAPVPDLTEMFKGVSFKLMSMKLCEAA